MAGVSHLIRRAAEEIPLSPLGSRALDLIDAWVCSRGDATACSEAERVLMAFADEPLVDALVLLLAEPQRCEDQYEGSGSGWWKSAKPVRSVDLARTQRTDPGASHPLPESLAWTADVFREAVPSPPWLSKMAQ